MRISALIGDNYNALIKARRGIFFIYRTKIQIRRSYMISLVLLTKCAKNVQHTRGIRFVFRGRELPIVARVA